MSVQVKSRKRPALTEDGHFPAGISREYEERLVRLCASSPLEPKQWAAAGPAEFMAGLAVMVACGRGTDRRGLLALAEKLRPGSSEPDSFELWLKRSPLHPSDFFPRLERAMRQEA